MDNNKLKITVLYENWFEEEEEELLLNQKRKSAGKRSA